MNEKKEVGDAFEVIVGNIGSVYWGESLREALATYWEYVSLSMDDYGRAGGEDVTMFRYSVGYQTSIEHEYVGERTREELGEEA